MKLITLLCVCLSITVGTWAYSPNCAQGPKYWCRDASTARDCGAVQHCEQTVWRTKDSAKKPSTAGETAHMLCNVLVHASSELLAAGSSNVDSIHEYLRRDCSKLPHQGNLIQQCEMAVDIYLADILRHLASGTETAKICWIIQGHDTSNVVAPQPEALGITPNQTCVLCEFIVHVLETFATANASAQELAHILDEVCHEMPTVLRDECKSFVDTYGADLIALLVREFDPAKACTLIKLCPKSQNVAFLTKPNSQMCGLCDYVSTYLSAGHPKENVCKHFATENNLKEQCEVLVHLYQPDFCAQLPLCLDEIELQPVEQPVASAFGSPECALCKYVVNYIDAVIQTNKSEAAIEAALEKVCGILPAPLKAPCVKFVDSYGPILVQLIEKYGAADKVCNALKLCNNGTQATTSFEHIQSVILDKASLSTVPCVICKYVIGYLETTLQNNRSTAAVEAALDKVCNVLPGTLKNSCTSFVHEYGPIIAFLFKKNATAQEICDYIKVCSNGTQTVMPDGLDHFSNIGKESLKSLECALCKYVVGYIDTVIQNNKSEAAIEAALEKVCGILPVALNKSCSQFVVTYGPILVQLIEKYGTADKVCSALKLCNSGTEEITPLLDGLTEMLKEKQHAVNSAECALCKYVVNYIDAVVQTNKSEAAIEAALEKVCGILPAPLKAPCVKFVDSYGPILVQLIEKYGAADKVCNALKLCNNGTQAVEPIAQNIVKSIKNVKDGLECTLCKYILNYVNLFVQSNKTAAEIEKALEVVCSILPSSYHDKCTVFVHAYGPILVELIAELDDPNTVCEWLGLCSKSNKNFIQIPAVKSNKLQSLPCNLCEYVVHYLDAIIQSNSTETKFEEALDKACKVLPEKKLQAECKVLVHLYGGDLIKLLVEYGDPKAVCQAIGICDK